MKQMYLKKAFAAAALAMFSIAGLYAVEGEEGEATAPELPKYSLTPKQSSVDELSQIVVTFPEGTEVSETCSAFPTLTWYGETISVENPNPEEGTEPGNETAQQTENVRTRTEAYGNTYTITVMADDLREGNYVLTIPANTLSVDGVVYSEPISQQYLLTYPALPVYTVFPKTPMVEELTQIVVTFPESATVEETYNGFPVLTNGAENFRTYGYPNDNSYVIDVRQYTPNGNYVLTIPAKTLRVDGVVYREEIALQWTVEHDIEFNPNVYPYNGSELNELGTIELTFDNVNFINFTGEVNVNFTQYNQEYGYYWEPYDFTAGTNVQGNKLNINIDRATIGDYIITIPAESIWAEGKTNEEEIVLNYTIRQPFWWYSIEPEPYPYKLDEISEVTMDFYGQKYGFVSMAISNLTSSTIPYLTTYEEGETGKYVAAFVDTDLNFETGTLTMKLSEPVTESGLYEVVVPSDLLYMNWNRCPEYRILLRVENRTGVEGIAADANGEYTVYSTQGQLIYKGADKAAVDALGKGLYIINGEKVMK